MSKNSLNPKILTENEDNLALNSLQGKTLLIYWTLLKNIDPMGVRELQRILDLSSPSLVTYHLNKLELLKLIEKTKDGSYFVVKRADISEIKDLFVFKILNKTLTLPRMFMYAITFSVLYIFYIPIYIFFDFGVLSNSFIFANIFALLGNTILWYETYKAYKGLPFN